MFIEAQLRATKQAGTPTITEPFHLSCEYDGLREMSTVWGDAAAINRLIVSEGSTRVYGVHPFALGTSVLIHRSIGLNGA